MAVSLQEDTKARVIHTEEPTMKTPDIFDINIYIIKHSLNGFYNRTIGIKSGFALH